MRIRRSLGQAQLAVELLNSRRFVIDIDAFDVAFHLAHKELGNRTFSFGSLRTILLGAVYTTGKVHAYLHFGLQFVL